MSSDVAALRQQVETECAAIHQALYGFAMVSKHETIANRYAALHQHTGQLAHVVGEQEANRFTCQTYAQVMGNHERGCRCRARAYSTTVTGIHRYISLYQLDHRERSF